MRSRPGAVCSHLGGAKETIAVDRNDRQPWRYLNPDIVRLRSGHGWVVRERVLRLHEVLDPAPLVWAVNSTPRTFPAPGMSVTSSSRRRAPCKLVECAAVRAIDDLPRGLHVLAAAVVDGEHALDRHDWQALGTADIVFHQALAALANGPRVDELMRGVLAELRLAWHVMANRRRFHEPYLARNREILDRLEAGDRSGAEGLLAKYLDDAERQLVAAYSQQADNAV